MLFPASARAESGGDRGAAALRSPTFVEHMIVDRAARFQKTNANTTTTNKTSKNANANKKPTSKQRLASQVYNLSLDVAALRQQLEQLTLHRSLLQTRALYTQRDPDGSAYKNAVQYWEVFARGYQSTDARQPAFLRSVADDNLQLGFTGLGREELLQQWQLYTEYFAIRRYEMHSVRVIVTDDHGSQSCTTRGEGVFYGSFTRKVLEMVFPAVLQDQELTQQLLGKEMVTPIAFVLHFNADGRWVRHDGEADLFAALATALGNRIQAAIVMESAHVAEEGMIAQEREINEAKTTEMATTVDWEEDEEEEKCAWSMDESACEQRDQYAGDVAMELDRNDGNAVLSPTARQSVAFLLS